MIHQLLKMDQLVLDVLKLKHIAMLTVSESIAHCRLLENRIRRVFVMTYKYHHCSVTRDDMAANNQKARKAIEVMGELDDGYLTGLLAVENAPQMPAKRELAKLEEQADITEDDLALLNEMLEVSTKEQKAS